MLVKMWSNSKSHSLLVGIENGTATLGDGLEISNKTKHDPEVEFSIYAKRLETYIHTKTCMQMFIAASFITAQTWEQSRCPSVGYWINELWCIQTIKY